MAPSADRAGLGGWVGRSTPAIRRVRRALDPGGRALVQAGSSSKVCGGARRLSSGRAGRRDDDDEAVAGAVAGDGRWRAAQCSGTHRT